MQFAVDHDVKNVEEEFGDMAVTNEWYTKNHSILNSSAFKLPVLKNWQEALVSRPFHGSMFLKDATADIGSRLERNRRLHHPNAFHDLCFLWSLTVIQRWWYFDSHWKWPRLNPANESKEQCWWLPDDWRLTAALWVSLLQWIHFDSEAPPCFWSTRWGF